MLQRESYLFAGAMLILHSFKKYQDKSRMWCAASLRAMDNLCVMDPSHVQPTGLFPEVVSHFEIKDFSASFPP